jgi:hypothetical protein
MNGAENREEKMVTCIFDLDTATLYNIFIHLNLLADRGSFRRTCKLFSDFREAEETFLHLVLAKNDQGAARDFLENLLLAPDKRQVECFGGGFLMLASHLSTDSRTIGMLASLAAQEPRKRNSEDLQFEVTADCLRSMSSGKWPVEAILARQNTEILHSYGGAWNAAEMMLSIHGGRLNSYYWLFNYATPMMLSSKGIYVPVGDLFTASMKGIIDLEYLLKFVDLVVKPRTHDLKELIQEYGIMKRSLREWKEFVQTAGLKPEDFPRVLHIQKHSMKVFTKEILHKGECDRGPQKKRKRRIKKTEVKRITKTE